MLLVSTTDLEHRSEQHRAAIDAAVADGIQHVIYTSMVSPEPPNPAVIAPSHYSTEITRAQSGISWTALRNNLYAEYQVPEAVRAVATGSLVHNRGTGRVADVAREDCAAVAAAAVLTSDGHACATYDVTGPESYDAAELATLYGELGGRRVAAMPVEDAAFLEGMVGTGTGDDHAKYGARLVASFGRAIREGYFANCTDTVEQLTERRARTLREVIAAGL